MTRRAAGFPMLFLCIVAGEDPVKSRPLLAECIQTLLALANEPLPQDWGQTVDLPQVRGQNCLSVPRAHTFRDGIVNKKVQRFLLATPK